NHHPMGNPPAGIEAREVAKLKPYAKNARTHSPEQIDQLVASIEEFGFTIPILVDEKGMVLAGHGRLAAAEKRGMTHVPVLVAKGWSEQRKKAYVIADNRLAENAGWDRQMLG
ncbi:ParB N-terminal domain-containing protein, partial [Lacticaseibacillus rhamnosus]|uniref:ParB/Srx family N-terminal domain-containing protein n=1 Tax=Lacticaseibacillus rhamnosus TaxID=47715 RepID=UPI0019526ACD